MKFTFAICLVAVLAINVKSQQNASAKATLEPPELGSAGLAGKEFNSEFQKHHDKIKVEITKVKDKTRAKDQDLRINLVQYIEFTDKILQNTENLAQQMGVDVSECVEEIKESSKTVESQESRKNSDFFQKVSNEVAKYGNDLVDVKVLQTTVVVKLRSDVNNDCQKTNSCTAEDIEKIKEGIEKSIGELKNHMIELDDINRKVLDLYGIVENFVHKSSEALDAKKLQVALDSNVCVNRKIAEAEDNLKTDLQTTSTKLEQTQETLFEEKKAHQEIKKQLMLAKLENDKEEQRHKEEVHLLTDNCETRLNKLDENYKNVTVELQSSKLCQNDTEALTAQHKIELDAFAKKLEQQRTKCLEETTRVSKLNQALAKTKVQLEDSLKTAQSASNASMVKFRDELKMTNARCAKAVGELNEELKNQTFINDVNQRKCSEDLDAMTLKHKNELEFLKKQYEWEYNEQISLLNSRNDNATVKLRKDVARLQATNDKLQATLKDQAQVFSKLGAQIGEATKQKAELQKNLTTQINLLEAGKAEVQKLLTEAEEKLKLKGEESSKVAKACEGEKVALQEASEKAVKAMTQERDRCLTDYDLFKAVILQALNNNGTTGNAFKNIDLGKLVPEKKAVEGT